MVFSALESDTIFNWLALALTADKIQLDYEDMVEDKKTLLQTYTPQVTACFETLTKLFNVSEEQIAEEYIRRI